MTGKINVDMIVLILLHEYLKDWVCSLLTQLQQLIDGFKTRSIVQAHQNKIYLDKHHRLQENDIVAVATITMSNLEDEQKFEIFN